MLPSLRNFLQSFLPFGRVGLPVSPPPRCVVLVRTDMFGDHVIFGGFIEKLREAWPQTRLVLVATEARRHLYEACPHLDEPIFFDGEATGNSRRLRSALYAKIRALRPDFIINTQYTRCYMGDRIVRYCHAPVRLGVTGPNPQVKEKQRRRFDRYYTHLLRLGDFQPARTEIGILQGLLEMLGVPGTDYRPRVWTSPEDAAFAERTFQSSGFMPERTLICFSGSSSKLRAYPPLRGLLTDLLRDSSWTVIAVGGQDDHANGEPPAESLASRWLNLCGRCTIRESAELMRRCRLVLGVETGLAQVALAVGVPQVILQSGTFFGRFLSSSSLTSLAIQPLDCYFCHGMCKWDQPYCLTQITPETFRRAIADALAGPSSKTRIYFAQPPPAIGSGAVPHPEPAWDDSWIDARTTEIVPVAPLHLGESSCLA